MKKPIPFHEIPVTPMPVIIRPPKPDIARRHYDIPVYVDPPKPKPTTERK